jgi:hypothetical protein
MKKILVACALGVGFYTAVGALNIDAAAPYISTGWECIPTTDGVKEFCVWTYNTSKNVASKLVRIPPQTTYQYLSTRAKDNPFGAIGVATVLLVVFWILFIIFRLLFRFLYWLLFKSHAPKK